MNTNEAKWVKISKKSFLPVPLDLNLMSPLDFKSVGCGSVKADRLCQPCERQVDANRSQGKEVSKLGSNVILGVFGEDATTGDEV